MNIFLVRLNCSLLCCLKRVQRIMYLLNVYNHQAYSLRYVSYVEHTMKVSYMLINEICSSCVLIFIKAFSVSQWDMWFGAHF